MVEYEIPFVGQQVDTDDKSESIMNLGESVLAVMTLFSVMAISAFGFQRAKEVAGVEGDAQIPGV